MLDIDTRKRYVAKTSLIGSVDPYTLKQKDPCKDINRMPFPR